MCMSDQSPHASLADIIVQQQQPASNAVSPAAPPAVIAPVPQQSAPAVDPSATISPVQGAGLAGYQSPPVADNLAAGVPGASYSPAQSVPDPSITPQPAAQESPEGLASSFGNILKSEHQFNVPDGISDSDLAGMVADQLDKANSVADEAKQWRDYQSSLGAEPGQPVPSVPPQPPAPQPSALPTSLSGDAEGAAQAGLVYRDESGTWSAKNAAFQVFADEHNRFEAYRQQIANKLVSDPDGFFTERIDNLGVARADEVATLKSELQSIREHLNRQQKDAQDQQLESWIDQHKQMLFEGGDEKKPTEYTQKYNQFASQIDNMAQGLGQKLDRSQIHTRTLEMLEAAGIQLQPVHPQAFPAPQSPDLQKPTLMQQAADSAKSPFAPVNRLPMVEQPSQVPTEPAIPTTPGGKPSLLGIIEQQARMNGVSH